MDIINTGLIGFGKSAEIFHVPFIIINPGYRLTTVFERKSERAKEKYPFLKVTNNVDDILNNPEIDLVVITTPNSTHYDFTRRSLLQNKHVIVEKPFTVTTKEADELISIARENKLVLAVYQNRRWDGDFITVKELISSGKLGQILEFESRFDRYRPDLKQNSWKEEPLPGSGIVYDLGSHLIDQCLHLFGIPETMSAEIEMQRKNSRIDDYFKITLQYKGFVSIVAAGMLASDAKLRFRIKGTKASYIKNGLDPQENDMLNGMNPSNPGWGKEPEENYGRLIKMNSSEEEIIPTFPGRYQKFYDNVYDAIINKGRLSVEPEQARDVILLIELAYKSSANNGPVPFKY